MLELKNITKDYDTGDQCVHALKGISLSFRENEFVSILGPSGCGKTTMLNIIGGLDRYTDGDLVIKGVSTKEYNDADWDAYRNHSVGFVFQSYNLIMHLSVLKNVELALTLSGISKSQRKEMAKQALIRVGLESEINKKPNQLSGGQMQRVAIARALVNNPDIILADEPTGALDTDTSVQVMELLKEVAHDKLVIMVTHNPELAKAYSTRIINLTDGCVMHDSFPYEAPEPNKEAEKPKKRKKDKKPSMSFFTALSLSLKNLGTKKTRTILTSFAGSIGIIGIALILSISSGLQNYIDSMEQETLSSYPLQVDKLTMDMESMSAMMQNENDNEKFPSDKIVKSNNVYADMLETMSKGTYTNDMRSFKEYIENNRDKTEGFLNGIQYSYNLNMNIYSSDYSKKDNTLLNPIELSSAASSQQSGNSGSLVMTNMTNAIRSMPVWSELIDNKELLDSQYDVLAGSWPKEKNEVVLVVDEYNQINDFAMYSLGLRDPDELEESINAVMTGKEINVGKKDYSFDELLGMTYKLVLSSDMYEKDNGVWINRSGDTHYMKDVLDKSLDIKISGIVRIKDGVSATAFSGVVGYTSELTDYIINAVNASDVVKEQQSDPDTNVFTGKGFSENESFETNLSALGVCDTDNPDSILFYAKGFEEKEEIVSFIDDYNSSRKSEAEKIQYTDIVGLMMSSITTIIDAVSYILIAFVTISLVVSSIMIGIITYISVLERTKEIGVLRSIGASKRDISRVFNAETLIVGFSAGIIGILISCLLNIPINIIIERLADLKGISKLPPVGGAILVLISMLLTLIAGLIPSKMAAKKDPVVALRSE